MTKPDWCPADVWEASRNIQFHIPSGVAGPSQIAISEAIARAILAERERALEAAAVTAYNMNALCCGNAVHLVAEAILALKETS